MQKLNRFEKEIKKLFDILNSKNIITEAEFKEFEDAEKVVIEFASKNTKFGEISDEFLKTMDKKYEELKAKNSHKINILNIKENDKIKFNKEVIEKRSAKKYKLSRKKAVVGTVIATGLIAATVMLTSCNSKTSETETATATTTIESVEETEELVMSESAKAFEDQTVSAVHEFLTRGINYKESKIAEDGLSLENVKLVESDKEVYAEMVAKYRLVANQANITNSEWTGYLCETSYSTLELVQNFYDVNNMLKNHLFGLKSDNLFDFNTLFDDENDAKLLNDFEGLIVEFNETKSEESAIKIKTYVMDNLTSTTGEFSFSNEAKGVLNSLLSAYVQMTNSTNLPKKAKLSADEISSFFTLEDGCEEYEGLISAVSTEESIQAMNIYSEVETKNQMIKSYILVIDYNEFNTIVYIIENAVKRIDLTVFEEKTVDVIEVQLEDKGIAKDGEFIGEEKAADASDVKAPNGTDISQTQLDKYNADTAAELEAAVEANPVLSEKTALAGGNGNAVDPALATSYTQQGAIDYNKGLNNSSSVPADYQSAYLQGWDGAKAAKIEADKKAAAPSTIFNDTQDVIQNSTSTNEEQGYVGTTPTPTPVIEETTVFVSLNNSENVIEVKTLTKQSSKMEYLQNAKSLFESFKTSTEEIAKVLLKLM